MERWFGENIDRRFCPSYDDIGRILRTDPDLIEERRRPSTLLAQDDHAAIDQGNALHALPGGSRRRSVLDIIHEELNRQRLDILVDGTFVHSFDPTPRGEIGCTIPGRLLAGQTEVRIVFGHPHAASPMLISGQRDDRRLSVSFARVSLICA